jgi:hypothetical protein
LLLQQQQHMQAVQPYQTRYTTSYPIPTQMASEKGS